MFSNDTINGNTISYKYYKTLKSSDNAIAAAMLRAVVTGMNNLAWTPHLNVMLASWAYLVAYENDEKIVAITVWDNADYCDVRARYIHVDPQYRSSGLFKRMRLNQIALLKTMGKKSLHGYFNKKNTRSIAAHKKLGYKEDPYINGGYLVPEHAWIKMRVDFTDIVENE